MRVEGYAVLLFRSFLEGQRVVSISNPAVCTLRIGYADHSIEVVLRATTGTKLLQGKQPYANNRAEPSSRNSSLCGSLLVR